MRTGRPICFSLLPVRPIFLTYFFNVRDLLKLPDETIESASIKPSKLASEIKNMNMNLCDNISILSVNIRGMKSNFNQLLLFLQSLKIPINIITICETWLNDHDEILFNIPGYTQYSISRSTRGGGLMMFVTDNLISNAISNFTFINDIMESLSVKIIVENKVHLVDLLYRVPSTGQDDFVNELNRLILQKIQPQNVVICGDLNMNLLGPPSAAGLNLLSCMAEKNFQLCTTSPTRVATVRRGASDGTSRTTTKTLIDHIWSSHVTNILPFVIESAVADHFPTLAFIQIPKANARIVTQERNFNRPKMTQFYNEFKTQATNFQLSYNDPCDDIFRLNNLLIDMINISFPIRTKLTKMRNIESPWIGKKLIKLIDKKYEIFKNYKNDECSFENFKT